MEESYSAQAADDSKNASSPLRNREESYSLLLDCGQNQPHNLSQKTGPWAWIFHSIAPTIFHSIGMEDVSTQAADDSENASSPLNNSRAVTRTVKQNIAAYSTEGAWRNINQEPELAYI